MLKKDLKVEQDIYLEIKQLILKARESVIKTVNSTLIIAYWNIGKIIIEKQGGVDKATYGDSLIDSLSRTLSGEFGAGFSRSNLFSIRTFYTMFSDFNSLSDKLSWSHYLELIKESNDTVRNWYLNECSKSNWSVRQLRNSIRKGDYLRVLEHKEYKPDNSLILGSDVNPKRALKDPYYLDFLGIHPSSSFEEKDIENSLMLHLSQFLLELGRGFSFIGRQKRILIDGDEFFVDLVFYNIQLNCYVLIDLKVGKLSHQDIGQMLTYVGYFDNEVKESHQNPTIGLILSEEKNDTAVKYALSGTVKPIFASTYKLVLPSEEELKNIINSGRSLLDNK